MSRLFPQGLSLCSNFSMFFFSLIALCFYCYVFEVQITQFVMKTRFLRNEYFCNSVACISKGPLYVYDNQIDLSYDLHQMSCSNKIIQNS